MVSTVGYIVTEFIMYAVLSYFMLVLFSVAWAARAVVNGGFSWVDAAVIGGTIVVMVFVNMSSVRIGMFMFYVGLLSCATAVVAYGVAKKLYE